MYGELRKGFRAVSRLTINAGGGGGIGVVELGWEVWGGFDGIRERFGVGVKVERERGGRNRQGYIAAVERVGDLR
jgi:hypothetical protein